MNQYRGQAAYPASLFPGQRPPQTVHRSDIFFSPGMNYSRYDPLYPTYPTNNIVSNTAAQLYPPHQQQFYGGRQLATSSSPPPPVPVPPKPAALQQEARQEHQHGPLHPTLYRSFTSPPPVPPKPSLLFEPEHAAIPTSAYLGTHPTHVTTTTTPISSPPPPPPLAPSAAETPRTEAQEEDDGDDLAVALALSKDESAREEERLKELARQEEEELARALAASMTTARGEYDYYDTQPEAGPSNRASSITHSSPFAGSATDLLTEAESSTPSSPPSTSEDISKDASDSSSQQQKSPNEELKPDKQLSQAQETNSITETANTASPAAIENLSIDVNVPAEVDQSNSGDQLPAYSPETTDLTPTTTTFSPLDHPSEFHTPNTTPGDNNDDYDGEGLPYLREDNDTPTSAIPHPAPPLAGPPKESNKPELSPISASLATLNYDDSYIDEDEALARRLAEEEEAAYRQSQRNSRDSNEEDLPRTTSVTSTTVANADGDLPTYSDAVSIASANETSLGSATIPELRVDVVSPASLLSEEGGELSRNSSKKSGVSVASEPMPSASSFSPVPFPLDAPKAVTLQPNEPQRVIGRTSSMSALPTTSHIHDDDDLPPPPDDDISDDLPAATSSNSRAVLLSASTAAATNNSVESSSGPSSLGVLNANHFVDAELLYGVCKYRSFFPDLHIY